MRVRAFVARIAGRYRRGVIRRGISLPLATASRALTANVVHRHIRFSTVVQNRVQMQLHLHRTIGAGGTPTARLALVSQTALRGDAPATEEPVVRRRAHIAEQLPRRARRIEVALSSRDAVVAEWPVRRGSPSGPETPAMTRALPLLRRHEPAVRSSESAQAPADLGRGGVDMAGNTQTTRSAQTRHIAPAIVADGEIERLAERVIGSIDRRIAAQRERLGRF